MKHLAIAGLCLAMVSVAASAQVNAGEQKSDPDLPFVVTPVTTLSLPWKIAFLPDGRMLITEKTGTIKLVTQQGEQTPVANVPAVLWQGQGGLLGIYLSPHYAQDHLVYLTYSEPGEPEGSSLALARAELKIADGAASLEGLQVIWRDGERGRGGQFGAQVAFSPDSKYLYLSVGDRQRMTPAQDPNQPLGKILRLTLDGKPAPGNPMAGKTGEATVPIINPPSDTEAAKTAPVVRTYTFPGPNLTPSETWSTGHRTPYGLAFAPDGRLWEVEHGPRGGDELNLIEPGKNYGWPLASYAVNYNGVPIPSPDTLPELTKPVIYWTPVIAPGNLMFYKGAMFPQWNGSAFVSGLATMSLVRITFDGKGGAEAVDRWAMGHRIRDVETAPDGALWVIEDAKPGGLFRLSTADKVVPIPGAQPVAPAAAPPATQSVAQPATPPATLAAAPPVMAAPAATTSTAPTAATLQHIHSLLADNNCLLCHKVGQEGGEIAPSLNGVGTRRTAAQIEAAILTPPAKTKAGIPNAMPPYAGKISDTDLKALVRYLTALPLQP